MPQPGQAAPLPVSGIDHNGQQMNDGGSGPYHRNERKDRDALARELPVIVLSADKRQQFQIDPH